MPEYMTYDEAAIYLNVKRDTLVHAVTRGDLTRCAYPDIKARLLFEQVKLFKGKRISFASLAPHERKLWEQYKEIALGNTQASVKESEVPQGINFIPLQEQFIPQLIAYLINRGYIVGKSPQLAHL
jgi:hypothetical protein